MTSAYPGVDIGTAVSKGVLVYTDDTVIAGSERTHGVSTQRPCWVEHDAEPIWLAEFHAIIRELLTASEGATLDALAISGIGPWLLPADAAGRPLRPAILYGVDTRAKTEIAEMNREFGAAAVLERGTIPIGSSPVKPRPMRGCRVA
ncbi:FGGY family carbohydrate kinase [Nocardia sp. NPDC051990]|uniref:FGGY family carbohydrate kinase n=1 Tax=Nocardia sp. NPDC051990 TaxID=3155285 RepID=UPI0034331B0D